MKSTECEIRFHKVTEKLFMKRHQMESALGNSKKRSDSFTDILTCYKKRYFLTCPYKKNHVFYTYLRVII